MHIWQIPWEGSGGTIGTILLLLDVILGLVLVLAVVLLATVFWHMWTGVPYVPTPWSVVQAMLKAAKLKKGDVVYDLGAGDGRLLIAAKRANPGIIARGCELTPTVWLLGKLCVWWSGQEVDLRLRDAFRMKVADADVIFLYVMPEMLRRLEKIFDRQLRPGTRVISNTFQLARRKPARVVKVPGWMMERKVYVYEW